VCRAAKRKTLFISAYDYPRALALVSAIVGSVALAREIIAAAVEEERSLIVR
jgi:hypothetical protein